jgi:nitroreductase
MSLERAPEEDGHARPHLTEVLEQRWSPRAFDPEYELTSDEIALVFEAARWSPSAGNSQPWSFILGLRGTDTHARFFEQLDRGNQAWAGLPSALIVTVCQVAAGPDHDLFGADHSQFDLGQSAAHMTVEAQSIGLHVHQFSGFDRPAVQAAFEVPDHWEVTSGIAIGRIAPAEMLANDRLISRELAPRTRRPIDEFVFQGRWGQPALS